MAKVIFRRIGGRLVPIRIGSVNDPLHTPGVIGRKITATTHDIDKTRVGTMHVTASKKGKSADVVNVAVEKKFQKHGISRALFKHAQELFGRAGKIFLRSSELQHPAQVKIRRSAGKSVFIGHGLGPYGEQSKKIGSGRAIRIIKDPTEKGMTVSATTMINKALRKKGKK